MSGASNDGVRVPIQRDPTELPLPSPMSGTTRPQPPATWKRPHHNHWLAPTPALDWASRTVGRKCPLLRRHTAFYSVVGAEEHASLQHRPRQATACTIMAKGGVSC